MSNDAMTLASVFDVQKEATAKTREIKESSSFREVKEKMSEKLAGIEPAPGFYDGLLEMLLKNLDDLLAIDLPRDVLVATWKKQKMLQKYCDKVKYPPGVKSLVPMIEHTLKTSHQPSMDVTIFDQPMGKLAVKLDAAFLIKGAILEVQDGKIKKVQTGDVESSGRLHFSGVPIMEKKVLIRIPAAYDLGDGVPINSV